MNVSKFLKLTKGGYLILWKTKPLFSNITYKKSFFMKGLQGTDKGKGNKILTWLGIVTTIRVLAVAVTFQMLGLADNLADKHASAEIDKKEESAVVDGVHPALIINLHQSSFST
ncbi:hypothetical protein COL64_00815 [Bacillus toyonensis]|nr:hypothetical protein CON90_05735 [Bacillus toyonensis]PEK54887.1 hypothetical protein CN588_01285 [Bacillus toyonensis]PEL64124.1 hypothetical protein CN633_00440 [Bacillus toyonensis]PFZ41105.1 hypothetical protein COL64_00815 [Bacillus toyonensis]